MEKKKIFICFAGEDKPQYDLFMEQALSRNLPYELTDVAWQDPGDPSWEVLSKVRITSSDAVIVLISKKIQKDQMAIEQINSAKEEGIPILGVYMNDCNIVDSPDELFGLKKINWSWLGISEFIKGLE